MLQWWRGLFAKPEKSAAEIDNEHINSMGLFNTAEAYRKAAQDWRRYSAGKVLPKGRSRRAF